MVLSTNYNKRKYRNMDVEFTTDISKVKRVVRVTTVKDYQEFLDNANRVGGNIKTEPFEKFSYKGLSEEVIEFVFNAIGNEPSVRSQLQEKINELNFNNNIL